MYYLVYSSTATEAISDKHIASILQSSNRNNAQVGITGMLLYSQGKFLQVLEGERSQVHQFYLMIVKNTLHKDAQVLLEGPLHERNFASWFMGFRALDETQFLQESGYKNIDSFFELTSISNTSHPALIFLKLFYKRNYSDHFRYLV